MNDALVLALPMTRLRANGAISIPNRERRYCTICGRDQSREKGKGGLRCLYCGAPLHPRGYACLHHLFAYPCPSILRHHRMKRECPTCRGTKEIYLYAPSRKQADAMFDRVAEFADQVRDDGNGNILRRFGERQ